MEKAHQRLKSGGILGAHFIKRLIGGLMLPLAFWVVTTPSAAAETLSLISDEETEEMLGKIIKPLFSAAGIVYRPEDIHLVDDPSLNAFVSDGNNLFINTGTIINADSPNELAGVIAHETGHIQGGHILRQKIKNQELSEISLASAILAGTAAAVSGRGDAAMAVMLGSQSSVLTHYTRYRTEEERSADEAAMKLLAATNQSPAGMLAFMKKISQQNTLNGIEESPYFRTHPVTRERIGFFEKNLAQSTSAKATPDFGFERVKAKLFAYLNPPGQTLRRYPPSDTGIAAAYARSIALFKQLKFKQALREVDALIAREPENPYFYELKGQILLETGKIKQARKAYQKAVDLKPNAPLLQISLAQAVLEDNPSGEDARLAVKLLNSSLQKRPLGFSWLLLSRAYALTGNEAAASYAAAEYSLRSGDWKVAKRQAEQAKSLNPSRHLALKIDDLLLRLKDIQAKS